MKIAKSEQKKRFIICYSQEKGALGPRKHADAVSVQSDAKTTNERHAAQHANQEACHSFLTMPMIKPTTTNAATAAIT